MPRDVGALTVHLTRMLSISVLPQLPPAHILVGLAVGLLMILKGFSVAQGLHSCLDIRVAPLGTHSMVQTRSLVVDMSKCANPDATYVYVTISQV